MSTVTKAKSKFIFRKEADGTKRDTLEVTYDAPSIEGLIEYLQGDNEEVKALVLGKVHEALHEHMRPFAQEDREFSQETADALVASGEVTLENVAKQAATTTSRAVTKEELEAFAEDYREIMPGITGKTPEQVGTAAVLFVDKFASVRANKEVLAILEMQLGAFVEGASQEVLVKHEDVVNYCSKRLEQLLKSDKTITADAL